MNQFSQNGETVQIEIISGQLLFIDPIYLGEIAATDDILIVASRSDMKQFIRAVEEKVFPYGGGSLLGFKSVDNAAKIYELDIASVTYYNSDEPEGEIIEKKAVEKSITAFGVDSASFLIIDLANFDALLPLLHADDLFDLNDNRANGYIEKINIALGNQGWAYIASPGIGKGYDFEGDGSFFISPGEASE